MDNGMAGEVRRAQKDRQRTSGGRVTSSTITYLAVATEELTQDALLHVV